ncbi:pyridoxamine 5'-phosphate oxidase family protein [Sulfurospirillum oryzae]|uniref:pyridoxamine 5'-phosphate oxidase family protein n=1 Tax=Sulfurospirillum oryzae TaxID=2976535 RepID=UPI0021E94F5E|nr:pyridoxamine 5'-phosphate oxidase family protein [Sulfurospirillum oryzae]
MRRSEFEVHDKAVFEELLATCEYGTLSLIDEDEPYGVPLNFVWYEESLCFHGSKEGRKAEVFRKNAKASFSVVKALSLIPSYFSNTRSASPATQFFISVQITGKIEVVEDVSTKCAMLTALMQKLQPEGGYDAIEVTNPIYTKMVEQTGLFRLMPESISIKFKAGQNLSEERRNLVIEKLLERGEPLDLLSVKLIQEANKKA